MSRTIDRYSIITGQNSADLVRRVNDELRKGWEPLGSVFLNEHGYPSQPVVMYRSPNQD